MLSTMDEIADLIRTLDMSNETANATVENFHDQTSFQTNLPLEIQDLIWTCAITSVKSRSIGVENDRILSHSTKWLSSESHIANFCTSRGQIPLVLQICSRSRELALQSWKSYAPYRRSPAEVFFDLERDALYVGPSWKINTVTSSNQVWNTAIEFPGGECSVQIGALTHRRNGMTLAQSISGRLDGIIKVIFIVRDLKLYDRTNWGPDELVMGRRDVDGWTVAGFRGWYESKKVQLPEVRFTADIAGRKELKGVLDGL